jgi:hypothetical protein
MPLASEVFVGQWCSLAPTHESPSSELAPPNRISPRSALILTLMGSRRIVGSNPTPATTSQCSIGCMFSKTPSKALCGNFRRCFAEAQRALTTAPLFEHAARVLGSSFGSATRFLSPTPASSRTNSSVKAAAPASILSQALLRQAHNPAAAGS